MGGENEKAVTASYEVSRLIATSGKPHTIGEDLILPAAKQMVSIMLGNKAVKQLNFISLSNNTVKRRINGMSENVFQQLICRVRASLFYAIQIDESTDIVGMANLLTFVMNVMEKLTKTLFFNNCFNLHTNATMEAIFDILNDFIISNDINWTSCSCYDGLRQRNGEARQRRGPAAHSLIHREALATKRMLRQ